MNRIAWKTLALALLAGCGSSGLPDSPTGAPVLVATPGDGAALGGPFTVSVTATGNYVNVSSLAFTEPAAFTGAKATVDDERHTATVAFTGDTSVLSGNSLTVRARAVDAVGKSAEASWTFRVSVPETAIALDDGFASYRDEAGATPTTAAGLPVIPARYTYLAAPVAVATGGTIHKIAGRLRWNGDVPSAAQLESAPDTSDLPNLPVMRFLVPHAAGAPAIVSAQATVTVGAGAPVTVALTPAATSPSGALAFLLPLAGNLIPDLGGSLPAQAPLAVTVRTTDAADHVASGGPWVVTLIPLPPPLVVKVDSDYAQAADPLSAYPYKLGDNTYANLWGSGFAAEGGVRVAHFTIANPDPTISASLGVTLGGGPAWSLAETWPANRATQQPWTTTGTFCSPNGSGGCTCYSSSYKGHTCSGVWVKDVGASDFTCLGSSYGSGPAAQAKTASGALAVTAHRGSVVPRDDGRFVVPAATANAPGLLDVYVLRPASDRSTLLPLTWVSAGPWYEGGTSYATRQQTNSSQTTNQGCITQTQDWSEIQWDWRLTGAVETITGTASFDARPYGTSAYGATAAVGSVPLAASITH